MISFEKSWKVTDRLVFISLSDLEGVQKTEQKKELITHPLQNKKNLKREPRKTQFRNDFVLKLQLRHVINKIVSMNHRNLKEKWVKVVNFCKHFQETKRTWTSAAFYMKIFKRINHSTFLKTISSSPHLTKSILKRRRHEEKKTIFVSHYQEILGKNLKNFFSFKIKMNHYCTVSFLFFSPIV